MHIGSMAPSMKITLQLRLQFIVLGGCGLFKLNTKLVDSNIIARINNEINDPEYMLRAYDT